jgi:splicing suppressor protein 51
MPSKCKERERLLESGVADVPALPVGAVRGYLCFRCFEQSDNILKCAACKRAGYCSKFCQKLDWSAVHKNQCKVLGRINEIDLEDYKESRTWDQYRGSLVGLPNSCYLDYWLIESVASICARCTRHDAYQGYDIHRPVSQR